MCAWVFAGEADLSTSFRNDTSVREVFTATKREPPFQKKQPAPHTAHHTLAERSTVSESEDFPMSSKSFWIAFLSGITAGSIVALLYAPQSGEETRKKIGQAYDDAGDYVEETAGQLKDQAERLTKEANAAYKNGVQQLDDAYSKATDALNTAYSEAKEKLASVADDALDQVKTSAKKASSLV